MGGKSKKRRLESEAETPEAEDSEINQRVENIIKSPTFFKTIREVVERQMKRNKSSDQLQVLEDVCSSIFKSTFRKRIPRNLLPANDLATKAFDDEENAIRLQMAAVFRLIDGSGWSSNIFCPATAKYGEYFIVNPCNMHYKNITAANLLRTDKDGNLYGGNSKYASLSKRDFLLNAAFHLTYPDVKCVLQLKHPACVAIAATNTCILPLSSDAIALGKIVCIDLRLKNEQSQKSEILNCFQPNTKSTNYHGVSPPRSLKMLPGALNEIPSTNIKIEGYIIVADTNSYIHDYIMIKQLLQPNTLYKDEKLTLYLPWIVLKELDSLKERSQVSNFSRKAINLLHKNLVSKNSRLHHQSLDEYEESCSCFEMNNDDRILQSCRTLKVQNKVLLLTNDVDFQCEAILANVDFSSTTDFTSNLQVPLQQANNSKAVNSKGGKDKSSSRKSSTLSYPSISDEDKEAIERLKATGFEESLLTEAYFKNGRDETKTVDYILTFLSGKD